MSNHSSTDSSGNHRDGWWTRDNALIVVLVAAIALLLIVCWMIVQPFVSPIAWAVALAVVAHPFHTWIAARLDKPTSLRGLPFS